MFPPVVVGNSLSPSDDDRCAPSCPRPANQNTPSPECRASEMQYESRAVSLFALHPLSHPRYSRLEYRAHGLAICQKRDCSQSSVFLNTS